MDTEKTNLKVVGANLTLSVIVLNVNGLKSQVKKAELDWQNG